MGQSSLKVFDQALTTFHPRMGALNHPSRCHRDKSRFPLCGFLGFRGLGSEFKPNLGHDLGVDLLQRCGDLVWVVSVVEQERDLWDTDGLGAKVIQMMA